MASIETHLATSIKESGTIDVGDFVNGPDDLPEAEISYSTPIVNATVSVMIKTIDDSQYAHSFPVTSVDGFTLQLSSSDLSCLAEICWCAVGAP